MQIYKVDVTEDKFKDMNRRLQAIFTFYIDGASFISVDENWCYFLVYSDNKVIFKIKLLAHCLFYCLRLEEAE